MQRAVKLGHNFPDHKTKIDYCYTSPSCHLMKIISRTKSVLYCTFSELVLYIIQNIVLTKFKNNLTNYKNTLKKTNYA